MMDERLKRLAFQNDNSKAHMIVPDKTGGLMDKFWKEDVPVYTEDEQKYISKLTLGKEQHVVHEDLVEVSAEHKSSSSSQGQVAKGPASSLEILQESSPKEDTTPKSKKSLQVERKMDSDPSLRGSMREKS